jgi:ubiquinone/menaquinone biosynthesis C-methylase UbiE
MVLMAVQFLGILALLYGGWMSSYMTWSSKFGKLRTRDALLARAGRLRPWRGDEVVADIGCGRGLMLIGAAKLLRQGTAIGVDLWRDQDQSDNSPEAVLENARSEGVAQLVQIQTGDARQLPLENESVDAVLSHWVIHNLESAQDRIKALDQMWRVLRPGGLLLIADIANVPDYVKHYKALGADCDFLNGGLEAKVMGILSGGTYKPQALLCLKPMVGGVL